MAKEKSKTCPECGGSARGRGFAHASGCSKATRAKVKGKGKKRKAAVTVEKTVEIWEQIDGRTKTSTLLRLQSRIEELLADRDKGEVKKVKDALANVQKLRAELLEAEKLIT